MITAMITQTIVIAIRLETFRVGQALPDGLGQAGLAHQPAEGDPGAEQEDGAPVDREHEQQAGGQDGHHALVQPAVDQALGELRVVAQEQADQPGQRPQGDGHEQGHEHDEHDRQRHQEPLEEDDRLAGLVLDQAAADQVRGGSRWAAAARRR
ncbi:MAG TPA: hypothetical protein VL330_02875 [Actinomycetes bacterium]|nr:hypothetical protein [Actinomycetes bacterium]